MSPRTKIVAGALLALGVAAGASAQPLPASCPNGGPDPTPFGVGNFPAGAQGTPMLRVTLNSTCNDGTPAIMYIRTPDAFYTANGIPAQMQEHERWVIQFQGGGGCGDADECLQRWCGLSGMNVAGKMSTQAAYDAIPYAHGIFRRDPAMNQFAGYNQVLLYYCSSDNWVGSGSQLGVQPSLGPSYDIQFNGAAIVREAFDRLVAGGIAPDAGPAATFWNDTLPSLLTAEEIVLVGDSAGSQGLSHHIDRLVEWLHQQGLPAETRVVGVFDAGMAPALWETNIIWNASSPASYQDFLLTDMADRMAFWGADLVDADQSCQDAAYAAAHVADLGSHPEVCWDSTYTRFNHITTPLFQRQDINDTLGREKYVTWGVFPGGPADYWAAQYSLLTQFTGGIEPLAVTPGLFGPRCNEHVSVNSDHFFTRTVLLPVVGADSFHDLLVNWMYGGGPTRQVQQDWNAGPAYTASVCP
jgi:hypothetical protein